MSILLDYIKDITPRDLLPGAKELLEEIRGSGLKIALGSASAPDLFLHTATQLGSPPSECVVVEDAAAGIEAAKAGGFRSVGLGPVERVGSADAVLPSLTSVHLSDLLEALRGANQST